MAATEFWPAWPPSPRLAAPNTSRSRIAETSVPSGLVGLYFIRRAVGDLLTIIEHDDPVREIHHDAHVMLDQRNRGAVVAIHVD
ncbi:hypothetical protein NL529_28225, partial [Klebsiella pneumoniae]|nr:hypothetical protein [Klebsiella pneumoniae]